MPIPPNKEIQIPLLHPIHTMCGEIRPQEIYGILAVLLPQMVQKAGLK